MSNAKRTDFALPSKKAFPLDTPGRIAAAPGLAAYSAKKGNITKAQEATVKRKAAAKREPKTAKQKMPQGYELPMPAPNPPQKPIARAMGNLPSFATLLNKPKGR